MRRYKKVDVGTWADEGFLSLSPLQPSGQALWLWLLTTPQSHALPGLVQASLATIADVLGWPLADAERCLRELEERGMAYSDPVARIVWLPNAARYNRPENFNVVRAWRLAFDAVVPKHSPLRWRIGAQVGNVLRALGEPWMAAWEGGPKGGRRGAEASGFSRNHASEHAKSESLNGKSKSKEQKQVTDLRNVSEQPTRWERLLLRLDAPQRETLCRERDEAEREVESRFAGHRAWKTEVAKAHMDAADALYARWTTVADRSAS